MATARVTVDCHHCGKKTSIDLGEDMSMQRCGKCGLRLNSVVTTPGEVRRKRVSGDPMLRRYREAEKPEIYRRKRKRFADPRRKLLTAVLLFLFLAVVVGTAYFVWVNPYGAHRKW